MAVAPHGITLIALLFAAATTGLMYMSAVWSEALKDELDMAQDDIETSYLFYSVGGAFSVIPGYFADRLGARLAIALGGTVQTLGLFGTFAVARKWIAIPAGPVVALCACNVIGWLGVSMVAAASFSALSRLYAKERGLVVGVGKCWVGIFGALVTQGFRCAVPSTSDETSILFIGVLAGAALALGLGSAAAMDPFALLATFEGGPGRARANALLAIVGFSVVAATVAALAPLGGGLRIAAAAAIGVIFAAPCATAALPEAPWPDGGAANRAIREPLLPAGQVAALEGAATLEMVRSPACWLILYTFCVVVGGGVIVTVNGGQMAIAAGCGASGADTVVTIFAVSQAVARVAGGCAADACDASGRPIQGLLVGSAAAMAAAHALMWASTPPFLYGGCALAGAAYGSTFPVVVLLTRELWGERHFGANYNVFDGGGGCLGVVVFAKYLVQAFYDPHKTAVAGKPGEFTCDGPRCFPFPAVAALCGSAMLSAALLTAGPLKPARFASRKAPPVAAVES